MMTIFQENTMRHIRKNILVTLHNAEELQSTINARELQSIQTQIINTFRRIFHCQMLICGAVLRKDAGFNILCGIRNNSASKNTAKAKIRKAFPLFPENRVKFHSKSPGTQFADWFSIKTRRPSCTTRAWPSVKNAQLISETEKGAWKA